jgi:hypothetical protein
MRIAPAWSLLKLFIPIFIRINELPQINASIIKTVNWNQRFDQIINFENGSGKLVKNPNKTINCQPFHIDFL